MLYIVNMYYGSFGFWSVVTEDSCCQNYPVYVLISIVSRCSL